MKIQNIKGIILGPRQLTFGFENNVGQEQNLIVSCIIEQFETHGRVILDKFILHVKEQHDLTEMDALQYIFWSAHELKIHFRIDGKNIVPFKAKHSNSRSHTILKFSSSVFPLWHTIIKLNRLYDSAINKKYWEKTRTDF